MEFRCFALAVVSLAVIAVSAQLYGVDTSPGCDVVVVVDAISKGSGGEPLAVNRQSAAAASCATSMGPFDLTAQAQITTDSPEVTAAAFVTPR